MRIADKPEDFIGALESARTESEKVSAIVRCYLNGTCVHHVMSKCRYSLIIMSEELRRELGEAAVRAAKAVGYVGAGTVGEM